MVYILPKQVKNSSHKIKVKNFFSTNRPRVQTALEYKPQFQKKFLVQTAVCLRDFTVFQHQIMVKS